MGIMYDELYAGINLDLGCGANKQKNFIGMDRRKLDGVDIQHDIQNFPWPFPDNCCFTIIASHVFEHIEPKFSIALMDECWRVTKDDGVLAVSVPYPGTRGFWQDPTHVNGWNEATFQYFDPRYPLYSIYMPKPWRIEDGFPVWQEYGNLEVLLRKVKSAEHLLAMESVRGEAGGETLGISVTEEVKAKEALR